MNSEASTPVSLTELARLFFTLGVIGFGGPAAHIALMEEEVVRRRKWITHQEFLDLLGATNLIPGPTSTEMTLHIGLHQRGIPGMCVAGACFILPAATLSAIFAWMYVRYGRLSEGQDILAGVQGVVLALISVACYNLGKSAAKSRFIVILGVIAAIANFAGMAELAVLLGAGLVGVLVAGRKVLGLSAMLVFSTISTLTSRVVTAAPVIVAGAVAGTAATATISTLNLGLGFLGIGSILYGSGYVLFAFLEDWLVTNTHLLTASQLTDAIAVGQFTPGPVSSTATFIGFILNGAPGAIAATIGIFLPSFLFVMLLSPWIYRLRKSVRAAAFLDAVNIAAVALIAVVTLKLAMSVANNWVTPVIAVLSMVALLGKWIKPTVLILLGGLLGYAAGLAGWL